MRAAKALLAGFAMLSLLTGGQLPSGAQDKSAKPAVQQDAPKPHPEVQSLLESANTLAKQQKWPDALKGFDEALTTARRLKDKDGEARTLASIGNIYFYTGRLQEALAY